MESAPPSVVSDAASLWGADPEGKFAERIKRLTAQFTQVYGSAPQFVARAPGRVNLIGEHIDYSGYSVLPMAVEPDIVCLVSVSDASPARLELANSKDSSYPKRTFNVADYTIDAATHEWSNYVLAAHRAFTQVHEQANESLQMLFDGTVPPGSGLSSSSALVCCSLVAFTHAHNAPLSRMQIASVAISGERFVGVESGGMDQSISMLGEAGKAKLVSFDPLTAADVNLPPGAVFVVANSLVTADKHVTAPRNYNLRVVECRLAALLLHTALLSRGLASPATVRTLSDVQRAAAASLDQMIDHVTDILRPGAYTVADAAEALGMTSSELIASHMSAFRVDTSNGLLLRDRSLHVFSEARRVLQFKSVCDAGGIDALDRLGDLMNASQEDCRAKFGCSCDELDELTEICRKNGAMGSRLTGAGWGGCTVSLVHEEKASEFVQKVKQEYYQGERAQFAESAIFATRPGNGAAIMRL